MKFAIYGCGNMGEAFLKSSLEKEVFAPADIIICNRDAEKNEILKNKYNIAITTNPEDLKSAEIILLGFKPQNLAELESSDWLGKIIISILAGTKIEKIAEKFMNTKIVRTMPNLGQFVGMGMSGIFFDPNVDFAPTEKELVKSIFESGGKIVELAKEEELDNVTAISGSGPAYFFLFAEKLVQSAKEFGFADADADLLVRQTLAGASEILQKNSEDSISSWRERVTSKGGTTEQAILSFENSNLQKIVQKAVESCEKKAKKLSE